MAIVIWPFQARREEREWPQSCWNMKISTGNFFTNTSATTSRPTPDPSSSGNFPLSSEHHQAWKKYISCMWECTAMFWGRLPNFLTELRVLQLIRLFRLLLKDGWCLRDVCRNITARSANLLVVTVWLEPDRGNNRQAPGQFRKKRRDLQSWLSEGFFPGGGTRVFFQNFSKGGGRKVDKFVFSTRN